MSNKGLCKKNYKVYENIPFRKVLRLESETKVYVPVAAVTNSAPVEVSTSVPHNLPDGWRVKVTGISRMPELSKYNQISNSSPGTFQINNINTTEHKPYDSGGIVEYRQPIDLDNLKVVLTIYNLSGELLDEYDSNGSEILLDNVDKIVLIDVAIDFHEHKRVRYAIVGSRTDIDYDFPIMAGYLTPARW